MARPYHRFVAVELAERRQDGPNMGGLSSFVEPKGGLTNIIVRTRVGPLTEGGQTYLDQLERNANAFVNTSVEVLQSRELRKGMGPVLSSPK